MTNGKLSSFSNDTNVDNNTYSNINNNVNDTEPLLSAGANEDQSKLGLEIELSPSNDCSTTALNTSTTITPANTQHQTWQIIIYMLVFFFMMIGHEIALEAASTTFKQLDSLASAVTLFQFGFCFFLPLLTSTKEVIRTFPKTWRATLPYVQLSILVFGATGLATQSLKYVSYPTKVVFKSAKLIPTMIVSTFVTHTNKSKYKLLDYFGALLLCLGAAGYSYNNSGSASTNNDEHNTSMYGILLLSISIICDALVPNLQQNLMSAHNQNNWLLLPSKASNQGKASSPRDNVNDVVVSGLSAQAVMVNTNAVGFGSILVYMLLSGSLNGFMSTAMSEPRLLFYLICVGVGLSLSVLAYTKLIHASGSVVAVAVSTLRKVVTVLLSYILFPKHLLGIHIVSGILVLIGVLIGTFGRNSR